MRIPLTVVSVFLIVIGGMVLGLVCGGLFGLAAGEWAPSFFERILDHEPTDPRETAVVLGTVNGLFLGAGLAAFAIVIQVLADALAAWRCRHNAGGTKDV